MILTQKFKIALNKNQEEGLLETAQAFSFVVTELLKVYDLDRISEQGGEIVGIYDLDPTSKTRGKLIGKERVEGEEKPSNMFTYLKEISPVNFPTDISIYTDSYAKGLFRTYNKCLDLFVDKESTLLAKLSKAKEEKDVKAIKRHTKKLNKLNRPALPVQRKPVLRCGKKSYNITQDGFLEFPFRNGDGKLGRYKIKTFIPKDMLESLLSYPRSAITLVKHEKFWMGYIPINVPDEEPSEDRPNIMGVDLNLRCPAVIYTSNGKTKFFGNGREVRFKRNWYNQKRQKTNRKASRKKCGNRESNWMKNIDHHISKAIVDFAVEQKVGIIKFEDLESIKERVDEVYYNKGKKRIIKTWSYGQVIELTKYKAKRKGIKIQKVYPEYTSQICPMCGEKTKNNQFVSRSFICSSCGYKDHLDRVAAINIMRAKVKSKKKVKEASV